VEGLLSEPAAANQMLDLQGQEHHASGLRSPMRCSCHLGGAFGTDDSRGPGSRPRVEESPETPGNQAAGPITELCSDEAVQPFWVCRHPLRLFKLLPGVVVVRASRRHYPDSVSTRDRGDVRDIIFERCCSFRRDVEQHV
jgi:hypothetical protein